MEVLNRIMALTGRHRPLLAFTLMAVLLGALGLALEIVAPRFVSPGGEVGSFVHSTAMMLGIAGLVSFFAGAIMHTIRGNYLELERRFSSASQSGAPRRRRSDQAGANPAESPSDSASG